MYDEENGYDRAPHLHWEMRGMKLTTTEEVLKKLKRKGWTYYTLAVVLFALALTGARHDWPGLVQIILTALAWVSVLEMRDNYAEERAIRLGQKQGWEVIGKRNRRA